MKRSSFLLVLFLASLPVSNSQAQILFSQRNLNAVNRRICGQVVDYTANHGCDRRIWSPTLCQKRDMYVYLPPGYNPKLQYPVMFWLHGIAADEWEFIETAIPRVDCMMANGKLPACIIVIPDGTKNGRGGYFSTHSTFLNTRLGRFEDYLLCDVWNFVVTHYRIRPERKAHVLAGVSLGGGSAYHHAIKYRRRFGVVLAIFPPLNVRWEDCRGRYFGNFDPCCWGWRTKVGCGMEAIGRFSLIVKIPIRRLVFPLYGRGPQAIAQMSRNNPIEMLDSHNVKPGELSMYVAYGRRDEFNIDAQVESFLFHARQKGLKVAVSYDPNGRHDTRTAQKFINPIVNWLAPQLAPYSPPMVLDEIYP